MSTTTAMAMVVAAGLVFASGARAEDKDASGQKETWTLTRDGKVLGTESLRLVVKDDGQRFASGEIKATLGKQKLHRKSHTQRGADGHLDKYQRVEAGLKGAGVRLYLFEGKVRVAPVNAPGKPTALDGDVARVWDADLWHLYALWDLPTGCPTEKKLSYLDPDKKISGQATLSCKGRETVYDAGKGPVEVSVLEVRGVPSEVELLVDGKGGLVGARGKDRVMLKAKWAWHADERPVTPGDDAKAQGDDDDDEKVDRGIGE
ncbi:MAG: hypothetical protein IT385_26925 [Deltaproteobacteria bacterium]|nr:hypothetical protein [Deltaproteobacteria bacterium]